MSDEEKDQNEKEEEEKNEQGKMTKEKKIKEKKKKKKKKKEEDIHKKRILKFFVLLTSLHHPQTLSLFFSLFLSCSFFLFLSSLPPSLSLS
jgi:hypothetical protein